jgi:hypothetical protein
MGELEQGEARGSAGLFMTRSSVMSPSGVMWQSVSISITRMHAHMQSSSKVPSKPLLHAGRRRLHLRQRNLAPSPCNRSSRLS